MWLHKSVQRWKYANSYNAAADLYSIPGNKIDYTANDLDFIMAMQWWRQVYITYLTLKMIVKYNGKHQMIYLQTHLKPCCLMVLKACFAHNSDTAVPISAVQKNYT